MFENQIPPPPVDMVMPPVNDTIATADFVLLAIVAFFVVRETRRTNSMVPIFILLGAALSSMQEPIYDIVGAVWYPHHGAAAYTRAFNVSIPMWLIPGYAWYIGGLGNFMYRKIRDGVTPGKLYLYYFLFWVANFLLEMPGLNLHIYQYYGEQPFKVLGFPLWMAMTNALMPLMIGALFNSLRDVLVGPTALLTIVIIPMVVGATQIAAGWPTWLALNNGSSSVGTHVAATLSLGLALSIIYLIGKKFCKSPA